jgi:hypothetical protein
VLDDARRVPGSAVGVVPAANPLATIKDKRGLVAFAFQPAIRRERARSRSERRATPARPNRRHQAQGQAGQKRHQVVAEKRGLACLG